MKTLKHSSLVILLFVSASVFGQNRKALHYYNRIIQKQYKITPMIVTFLHMQGNMDGQKEQIWTEKERLKIEKRITHCITSVEHLKAYQGDKQLKQACIDMLTFYKKSFNVEYKELLMLHDLSQHTAAEASAAKEIKLRMISEEEALDRQLAVAQETFASKYHLNLIDISNEDHANESATVLQ